MIEIKNLAKRFDSKTLFKNLTFTSNKAEIIAITGASGAGKSTLLNILGSIESIDSGSVIVDNQNLSKFNTKKELNYLRCTVSFLFQNYGLMEDKTVEENIRLSEYKKDAYDSLLENTLSDLGLDGMARRKVSSLSGGEQQRVALARIMLKPSKIILADEPTGNLDYENARIVWEVLKNIRDEGKTIVVATHDLRYQEYFDRIIEL